MSRAWCVVVEPVPSVKLVSSPLTLLTVTAAQADATARRMRDAVATPTPGCACPACKPERAS